MKINWKLRFQNKTTLITLATTVVAFIYQLLAIFDIVPQISEDTVMQLILLIISVLASIGIVVDPTTAGDTLGIGDSEQALGYEKPKGME